jgi:hypothetical protein
MKVIVIHKQISSSKNDWFWYNILWYRKPEILQGNF